MIKITDEIREAARGLLARHNAGEPERIEKRYQAGIESAKARVEHQGFGAPNKPYIRKEAECEHYADKDKRKRLEAIVNGTRKNIDHDWWVKVHGDVNRAKLEKIAAMADPSRNDNEHQRKVADAALAREKAKRPPGLKPEPKPLPTASEWMELIKTKRTVGKRTPARPMPTLSDSVATSSVKQTTDKLKFLNEQRALRNAAKRNGLTCQSCGKPLVAQRPTARYCNVTCRSRVWRRQRQT